MLQQEKILLGKGAEPVYLLPAMLNRHGLVAGATGTGKTVTIKVMAEALSELGVPVFMADVKGDLSGLALPGTANEKLQARLDTIGIPPAAFAYKGYPCRFWDVFGRHGTPVRATVSELGPLLLARLLNLSEVQEGVLNLVFKIADDKGWQLIDLKDLTSMLAYASEHRKEFTATYGSLSPQSVGAIQRSLLALETAGGEGFFGEPELDVADWLQTDAAGQGIIHILHAAELFQQPLLYATFLLWLLSELYEALPEVGDLEKPKLVFFFDEAHLLFEGAPKVLVDKVTQVVKLIRSKGVEVYFCTQNPADLPDPVLAQLNNRIQHALRAYTPAEQKAVRAAAQSFRPNPAFKTEDAIGTLGTGCALVSVLDEKGAPTVVDAVTICPPQSSFTPLAEAARAQLIALDPLNAKYKTAVDPRSAYEILSEEEAAARQQAEAEAEAAAAEKAEKREAQARQAAYRAEGRDRNGYTPIERSVRRAAATTARGIGRDVGRQITRGVLGTSNRTLSNAVGSLLGGLLGDIFR
ncbi:MAG: DUF853 family protein [Gemmiger sp.]|nr:DUF853 family protein [Gemmiger sp.]